MAKDKDVGHPMVVEIHDPFIIKFGKDIRHVEIEKEMEENAHYEDELKDLDEWAYVQEHITPYTEDE